MSSRRRPPPRLAVPVLAFALALAACAAPHSVPLRPTRMVEHDVPFDGPLPERLELQFHAGLVTLETGPRLEADLLLDLTADEAGQLDRIAEQVVPVLDRSADGREVKLSLALPAGIAMGDVRTCCRLRAPASVVVLVKTRECAVVARGYRGDLEVQGGSGMVDARLDGGTAAITTTSGSVSLRGRYAFANVSTRLGRVDVQVPPLGTLPFAIEVDNLEGDTWIELHERQQVSFGYRGELTQLRTDPGTRVDWREVQDLAKGELILGTLGEPTAIPSGSLRLAAGGPVHMRLAPETSPATAPFPPSAAPAAAPGSDPMGRR